MGAQSADPQDAVDGKQDHCEVGHCVPELRHVVGHFIVDFAPDKGNDVDEKILLLFSLNIRVHNLIMNCVVLGNKVCDT